MTPSKITLQLIERIRDIDPDAAHYIMKCYGDPETVRRIDLDYDCDSLTQFFIWHRTPQGYDYWYRINGILEGKIPMPERKKRNHSRMIRLRRES